jgi:hypothetical protein
MSEERRDDDRPPTFVLHAIKNLDADEKLFYRNVGLGGSIFCMVVPFVGEIVLTLAGFEDGLWGGAWAFAVLGFLAGLCFMFPALGMWLVQHLPSATDRIIPDKVREVFGRREDS